MFGQETTQGASEATLSITGGATKLRDVSPLQSALNEQGEQLDKLRSLLDQLSDRLQPVSNACPTTEKNIEDEPVPPRSMVAHQVVRQTMTVESMQAMVHTMLNELEV